ncbi:hypothetical protein KPL70_026342 [Citrus sinensis]|nr:hypothetical protein KPL70_026342 [Citrus sinensis]
MTTNKERIEWMEVELGEMQDKMQRMEVGINDKLAHIEETLSKLAESFNTSKDAPSTNNNIATSRPNREDKDGRRQQFQSKVAKLDFPRYAGNDTTEWFNRINQFFEYQESTEDQKELWARFGPTDCEDFDEALSRVEQTDSLREYQKEFERLGNRVHGWSQKALVGTFMGGLKPEIAEDIQMFRPRTLKEVISLARMKDDQITRQRRLFQPPSNRAQPTLPPTQASPTMPVKRLPWDEMQRRRAQGLCFTCNERFTAGHKCQGPQLLLLESYNDTNEITCEEVAEELHGEDNKGEQPGKTRHCYNNNFHT